MEACMHVAQRTLTYHVVHSNALERIYARQGPLYDQHRKAAQAVAACPARFIYDVPAIHRIMFGGQSRPRQIGRLRLCGVMMVGKTSRHHLPPARDMPALMSLFYELVAKVLDEPDETSLMVMQATLLCIHPFTDGNGRTARLYYNALRLVSGKEWRVTTTRQQAAYLRTIRSVEQDFFVQFKNVANRRST